jgi:hypothetical protein
MKEEFLHYVWQHRHYDFRNLKTSWGQRLNVLFPGYHNYDAGPDFLQAVVTIDDVRWVGNVEIHCRSSDWLRHKHQEDDKYKSVILHVVYEHDMEIQLDENEIVPTLELKERIPTEMFVRYESLMKVPDLLLCRTQSLNVAPLIIQSQLSEVLIERIMRRQNGFQNTLMNCHSDWNELIYRVMAVGFGCKKNVTAFELLAQSLPFRIVRSHLASKLQVYALVFGQSGLLDAEEYDEYSERLRYEYDYLRYKYQLTPIGAHQWNWLRLRPQNFPSLRLAQFAQLLYETGDSLMERVLYSPYPQLRQWLSVVPDDYWECHYQLGKTTVEHASGVGAATVDLLIINTVVPLRFSYARFTGDDAMQEGALSLLEEVRFEDNVTTRAFADSGFPCRSAYDSQAQLELMEHYCARKRCLQCSIGEKLVRL